MVDKKKQFEQEQGGVAVETPPSSSSRARDTRGASPGTGATLTIGNFGAYSDQSSLSNALSKDDFDRSKRDNAAPKADPASAENLKKEWQESKVAAEKGVAWNQDPVRRLAIRTFSRGLMGAAFFTGGRLLADKYMKGYDSTKMLSEHLPFTEHGNPLTFLAGLIDKGIGKPIAATVNMLGGNGAKAVSFRNTYNFRRVPGLKGGRSLGDEVVNITFDFFCASIGDAWGRDIVGWFDPNVKKIWMDKDGNIDIPKALKQAAKSTFQYVTYNGGEDWAVAIPYAYFMKAQRSLLEHMSPGFKIDFDRGLTGGSFKLDENHKLKGSFAMEAMLDLQSRFTVYNIGTLMYREAYNHAANLLQGKESALYGALDQQKEDKGLLERIGEKLKWAARSAIKGTIYMTPAVPAFWITRAYQQKDKGLLINPEGGILAMHDLQTGKRDPVLLSDLKDISGFHPLYYARYAPDTSKAFFNQFDRSKTARARDLTALRGQDPYNLGVNSVERTFDTIGRTNRAARNWTDRGADWADAHLGAVGNRVKQGLGIDRFNQFSRTFTNASISYTPYMYAKAEFANLWDDGKMDLAAERLIDGAANFNWGEFKAGASEVWRAFLHQPLNDPKREAEAQRRITLDSSPSLDKSLKEANGQPLKWQERIVAGKPLEKTERKKDPVFTAMVTPPSGNHGNDEMRKTLERLAPPTNAIN